MVRRLGRVRRRDPQNVCVLLAQHGQRWRFSSGLSARQSASVSGSARAGVRLFWWRFPCFAIRQPEERREENSARPSTGRNRAVHRFSLALGIRIGVLYARRGTRERRRGGRRGPVPAELSGAGAERAAPGGVEPAAGGGVARGAAPGDRGPRANHWRGDDRRTGIPSAPGRRGLRSGLFTFSGDQRQRVREGADELLLGAIAGGHFSPGEGLLGIRGGLVSGQVRGPARTLLRQA